MKRVRYSETTVNQVDVPGDTDITDGDDLERLVQDGLVAVSSDEFFAVSNRGLISVATVPNESEED